MFSAASALNTEEEKRVFEEEEDDIDHFYGNFDDDSYQVSPLLSLHPFFLFFRFSVKKLQEKSI